MNITKWNHGYQLYMSMKNDVKKHYTRCIEFFFNDKFVFGYIIIMEIFCSEESKM